VQYEMKMIRNLPKGKIRILAELQDHNATTDQQLEKGGMTPTDLAKYGLNKTLVLKHLPELKTEQLIIGKLIHKKGRPGNYYAITPLGTIQLFKHRLENETDDNEQYSNLEKIRNHYPLITKYWDTDLVDLDKYRYQSLLNAIDYFEIKSRERHYISVSITLPAERNFISFEKNYILPTTPKEKEADPIRDLFESKAKPFIINEIETDLRDLITFQFYYYLAYKPTKTLKLIKKLKDRVKEKKLPQKDYHKKLIEIAKETKEHVSYDFNLEDPIRLEKEIIQRWEKNLTIVKSIIEKDKNLKKLIAKQRSNLYSMFNSILHF